MKWKISYWMENIKLRLLSQVPLHTNCRWSTNKNAGWQNVRCYIRRHRWVSERTRHWTNIKHAEPPLGWNILLFLLRTTDSFHPTSGRSAHIAAARLRIEMSENRKFLNEKNRAEFSPQRLMTFLFSKLLRAIWLETKSFAISKTSNSFKAPNSTDNIEQSLPSTPAQPPQH